MIIITQNIIKITVAIFFFCFFCYYSPEKVYARSNKNPNKYYNEKIRTKPLGLSHRQLSFWPLNEGSGLINYNKINANYRGVIRKGANGKGPYWIKENGEWSLFFPGSENGGFVEINKGGEIISGAQFKISFEIKPVNIHSHGYLLACKHQSELSGGFLIYYWGEQKKILFNFADGKNINEFTLTLSKIVPSNTWKSIVISCDGETLTINTDDQEKAEFSYNGGGINHVDRSLLIGGYFNNLGDSFSGSIRNVSLSKPQCISRDEKRDKAVTLKPKKSLSGNFFKKLEKRYKNYFRAKKTPALEPFDETMIIANNLVVPNWFALLVPGKTVLSLNAVYFLDVPKGVTLLHIGTLENATGGIDKPVFYYKKEGTVKYDSKSYTRYKIKPLKIYQKRSEPLGPIYFRSSLQDKTKSFLYYSSAWDGGAQKPKKIILMTRHFPTPGQPLKIHTSIGWMLVGTEKSWPGFLDTYGKLGFNAVPTHGLYDQESHSLRIPFLEKARNKGYNIIYVDSAFHPMSLKDAGTISLTGSKLRELCPSYRGKAYWSEIDRIVNLAKQIKPNYIFWDIECFKDGAFSAITGNCIRCNNYIKRSGKNAQEAITDLGLEITLELRKRIKKALITFRTPVPLFGVYHTLPHFIYHDIFDFDKMYNNSVDFCMPVFYSSGLMQNIGKTLRKIRKKIIKGDIIPWLQPGTLRDYPSPWIYDAVLECFGSGARGLTWFSFSKMEGEDFFYFAKAMETINPVEGIIYHGKPFEDVISETKSISVSAICDDDEYLLLLSDYSINPYPRKAIIRISPPANAKLWNITKKRIEGKILNKKKIEINFKPGVKGAHTALYYLGAYFGEKEDNGN